VPGQIDIAMKCAGCGCEVSPGFVFCPQCGRRQPVPCAACGHPCDVDYAFCPRCGADRRPPAAAPAGDRTATVHARQGPMPIPAQSAPPGPEIAHREADRRQVTVLFADLCGFTTISERLDAEEVRAFQHAFFDRLGRSISRYDGFVAKFLGDAVLALFGAPVAHEDDPERALDAALDMLAAAGELSQAWSERLGQAVSLHIAVHTGPVVAGNLGDARAAGYDVTGDAVNAASRMLEAAAPGTVLVSAATYALTRHRFGFEAAGELALRGKSEAVVVHRLLGALGQPGSARGLAAHGLSSAMIGRTTELDRLLAAFDRMQHREAQFVSLVGEAGAGKSRLLAEFLSRLADDGRLARTTLRRVACSSLGEPTYGVFAALFREGYQVGPDDSLAVAREKLAAGLHTLGARPEIAQAIGQVLSWLVGIDEAQPRDFDPEQLGRQIALAGHMLVERRLEQGPMMVVVDDLHWADAASIELLRDIVDNLSDRPLMVLMAHRPDMSPPLPARAARTVVRVPPLSPTETRALVEGLFEHVDGAAFGGVEDFVVARAGGNPLFVEEVVRNLVSVGVLVRERDGWSCTAGLDGAAVPPTLQGLLLSRLDRLPDDVRLVLQEAAVLGLVFDEALLQSVASVADSSGRALSRLVESGLLEAAGQAGETMRYRFAHALMREAVYENLLLSRRSALHERAGRALEQAAGPEPSRMSDLEALGHHWSLTSDKAKGARYLMAAGDRARTVYANEDAIRHYERALRTLVGCRDSDEQVLLVRERLGDILALVGRRDMALPHYEAVQQALEAVADRAGVARLSRKLGALHWETGERERARACIDGGLAQLGTEGSTVERAQLFQELGRLAFRAGDSAAATAWAEQALAEVADEDEASCHPERARELAAMRAQAYNTLGVALARTGRPDAAVEKIEHSIQLAERHDLLQAACRGYTNLGVLYSSLDPRRSIETCLRGLETAKKVGDLGFQSRLYANLAVAYCALTERCEVEGMEAAHLAIDLDRKLGLLDHLAVPLIVLGQIHQCHGDHRQALAAYQEALGLAERIGEPQLLFPCYDGLATLSLDAGNMEIAETWLAKAREVCERAGLEPDSLLVLPFLC
jgi:adenylate cyclase